jgi:hypothetical protein
VPNLLGYRFLIFNALAVALAAALAANGFVRPVIEGGAPITWGILALFAIGWTWALKEIVVVSSGLNEATQIGATPAIEAEAVKDTAKVAWLSNVAEWLVALGLLGTVIGFAHALASVDSSTLGSATGAQAAVGTLMAGMRIAINTTLLGAALALWHEVNTRMLKTALSVYWGDRIAADKGVGNVRAVD